ncbi:MAG: hypothetical protein EOO65_00025 [Methanosarcinales archaeon]|nr:MAG: hypothetical protein EOO65_00025 [Methanosarcinales archaeon]
MVLPFIALLFSLAYLSSHAKNDKPASTRMVRFHPAVNISHEIHLDVYIRSAPRPKVGFKYLNTTLAWYLQGQWAPVDNVRISGLHVGFISRNASDVSVPDDIVSGPGVGRSPRFDGPIIRQSVFASLISSNYTGQRGFWRTVRLHERQQTEDMIALLDWSAQRCRALPASASQTRYVAIMEDDMLPCTDDLLLYIGLLAKNARACVQPPSAWRIGVGGHGFVFRCVDMPMVLEYMRQNKEMGPPDSLLSRFVMGGDADAIRLLGTRKATTFRFQLFEHIGSVRSIGTNFIEKFSCLGSMSSRWSMLDDAFNVKCNGLISPCDWDHISRDLFNT